MNGALGEIFRLEEHQSVLCASSCEWFVVINLHNPLISQILRCNQLYVWGPWRSMINNWNASWHIFLNKTLDEDDLWSKGRFNLMLLVGLHGLSKILTCNSSTSSNLIATRMYLQEIGKLWEGMLLNVESKRKHGARVHLRLLSSQAQMVVLEDL